MQPSPDRETGLVFAAIAPHGSLAIEEACAADERGLAKLTQDGFAELGRRFGEARPDVTVVLTPHNVHIEGHLAVVVSGATAGALEGAAQPIELQVPIDRTLALAVLDETRGAGVPCVGVSYGGNDAATAVMPMDWAVLIPLWYLGGRREPPVPVVVVAPARDRSPLEHVRAGTAIATAAAASGKRVALVASADHSHVHDPAGPYGYDDAAPSFDAEVVRIVERNDLAQLLDIDDALLESAKPDSWWQMLMLHGALGDEWDGELLSYEAPTYYGMLCAAYRRR